MLTPLSPQTLASAGIPPINKTLWMHFTQVALNRKDLLRLSPTWLNLKRIIGIFLMSGEPVLWFTFFGVRFCETLVILYGRAWQALIDDPAPEQLCVNWWMSDRSMWIVLSLIWSIEEMYCVYVCGVFFPRLLQPYKVGVTQYFWVGLQTFACTVLCDPLQWGRNGNVCILVIFWDCIVEERLG